MGRAHTGLGAVVLGGVLCLGCGGGTGGDGGQGLTTTSTGGGNGGDTGAATSTTSSGTGTSSNTTGSTSGGGSGAAEVAAKLGRDHFLIGMGNDLADDHDMDGAYTLGVTLDLHYAYLVGLSGMGGWPDWNPGGYFVNLLADVAESKGVVPMFTTYAMAAWGENQVGVLTNDDYMARYWADMKLLFERLGEFDKPAVVHLEPDFWGFTQQAESDPGAMAVRVTAHAPDCGDQPDTMVGLGQCILRLARTYAPKTLVGFHISAWAGEASASIAYLRQIGAGDADIIFAEMLDRDAGCFEAGTNPNCQRGGSGWYWDESNQTSPNFHEHLAWAKQVSDGLSLPMLWWQLPFGVPSDTPGGTDGNYRDNRVRYVFSHIDEFVAAGGVGAVFGVGAAGQTYITSDGGQFQRAVTEYFSSPYPLD